MDISVIIPWYGAEIELRRTLNSIGIYGRFAHEIIVVNDNAEESDSNVFDNCNLVWINNSSNIGAAQSRNKGANRATGDVLLFLDAGDELLNSVNEVLGLADFDVAYGRHLLDDGVDQRLVNRSHENYRLFCLARVPSTTSGLFVNRHLFLSVGGFEDLPRSQEAALWLKISVLPNIRIRFIAASIVRRNVDMSRSSISTTTDILDTTWLTVRLPYVQDYRELIGVFLSYLDVVARRQIRSKPTVSYFVLALLTVCSTFSPILYRKLWVR
jgi:glycosyltransferase involved in cell wall biosynthesis